MPAPEAEKAGFPLPDSQHKNAGKGNPSIKTDQCPSPPLTRKGSRKTKAPEDIDSDYAEEAEDFFYGEGM